MLTHGPLASIYLATPRYDDYKFVTRDEVDKLGITGLIGTPMLRAYMHGYESLHCALPTGYRA